MKKSDIFVLFDTAQFVMRDFHKRNKIKGPTGAFWLTIPIPSNDCYLKRILDVPLPRERKWAEKHLKSIIYCYKKAPYFEKYIGFFEELYTNLPERLVELNEKIILYLKDCFDIKTKIIKSSELELTEGLKSTEILIDILKKVGADKYISGKGREGKPHYLDVELMKKNGIDVIWQEFVHPVYKQCYGEFIKNLSAIDLLFNCGDKAKEII